MALVCQQCGAAQTERDAFCTTCGARREASRAPGAGRRFCTGCGAALAAETKFCTQCGAVTGATPSVAAATAAGAGGSTAPGAATGSPSARTETAPPTAAFHGPGAGSRAAMPKAVVIGAAVVALVLAVAVVAGLVDAGHRARERARERQAERTFEKNLAKLAAKGNGVAPSGTPSPAEINQGITALAKAANALAAGAGAGPATDATKGGNPAAPAASEGTPGGYGMTKAEAARLAAANDPATVANVIWRNRDQPPGQIPPGALPAGVSVAATASGGYTWKQGTTTYTWDSAGLRHDYYPRGTYLESGCPLPKPAPRDTPPVAPAAATGDRAHDWALKYERTVNGPEAALVVRTGDIDNLGFGWPQGFDPFSGQSTPPHSFPWKPRAEEPAGTDRIMVGSVVTATDRLMDGYSGVVRNCDCPFGFAAPCQGRLDSMPQAITLAVGALPAKIHAVAVQIFADDFQAPVFQSHFQVSLNGTRIPTFEYAVNSLQQTGPIGKLVTLRLLPEYWPLLQSGTVKLLIDDPTTHVGDGYAVDFVRILVNPHKFKYEVTLTATVSDADTRKPIAGAVVTAALATATTDRRGKCDFKGIPAGLVIATANAPGYDENSVPVDLPAGQSGQAEIPLHRHQESAAALEQAIAQTGSATIYGIHFDTGSAKLRGDSLPALNAVLGLINSRAGSRWIIAGHTDNQGSDQINVPLSRARAASVIAWLTAHGVTAGRLEPEGFGSTRPVADNATAGGRALNRRVEVALAQ